SAPAGELTALTIDSYCADVDLQTSPGEGTIEALTCDVAAPADIAFDQIPTQVLHFDGSAIQKDSDLGGLDALSAAVRAMPERLAQKAEAVLTGNFRLEQTDTATSSKRVTVSPALGAWQQSSALDNEFHRLPEDELALLSEKSERLLDRQ